MQRGNWVSMKSPNGNKSWRLRTDLRKKWPKPTKSRSILINDCMVGCMSPREHPRSNRREAIWFQAVVAFATLFALLAIRNAPPDFLKLPSLHHSSISVVSNHTQRPHFDFDGLEWSPPVSVFLPFPPTAEPAHLTSCAQRLSPFETKGFHYNRPPPIS